MRLYSPFAPFVTLLLTAGLFRGAAAGLISWGAHCRPSLTRCFVNSTSCRTLSAVQPNIAVTLGIYTHTLGDADHASAHALERLLGPTEADGQHDG